MSDIIKIIRGSRRGPKYGVLSIALGFIGRLFVSYAWLLAILFIIIALAAGYGVMLFIAFIIMLAMLLHKDIVMEKVDGALDILYAIFWTTIFYDMATGSDLSLSKYIAMLFIIIFIAIIGYAIDYATYNSKTSGFISFIKDAKRNVLVFRNKVKYSLVYVYGYVDGNEWKISISWARQASIDESDTVELPRSFLDNYTVAMDDGAVHGFFRLPAIHVDSGRYRGALILLVPTKRFSEASIDLEAGSPSDRAEAHLVVKDDTLTGTLIPASKKTELFLYAKASTLGNLKVPKGAREIKARLAKEKMVAARISFPLSSRKTYAVVYGDKRYVSAARLLNDLKKKLLIKTPMIIGCSDGVYEVELVIHTSPLSKQRERKEINLKPLSEQEKAGVTGRDEEHG